MTYEKPKLISLSALDKKGYGEDTCMDGSGHQGGCEIGNLATEYCTEGLGGQPK